MSFALHAALLAALPVFQDAVIPPPPRLPLPRPVASAQMAAINQNLAPAGRLSKGTLTVALDCPPGEGGGAKSPVMSVPPVVG